MKGKIVKYIEEKGYGFILDENGDKRFFHISKAVKPLEIQILQMVEFEPSETDKGLIANNIVILDSVNKSNNKFIKIHDTNIKCNNIKEFGISQDTETLYKQNSSIVSTLIFGETTEKIVRYEDLPDEWFGKDTSGYTQIVQSYNYLYITTYQGDNHQWRGSLNELQKMIKYIEENIS